MVIPIAIPTEFNFGFMVCTVENASQNELQTYLIIKSLFLKPSTVGRISTTINNNTLIELFEWFQLNFPLCEIP